MMGLLMLKEEIEPPLNFVFSKKVLEKLEEKHCGITKTDVLECFDNSDGRALEDTREEHITVPPTQWFISETNRGKRLKVCFVYVEEENTVYIKTAFEPNDTEIYIFEKYA